MAGFISKLSREAQKTFKKLVFAGSLAAGLAAPTLAAPPPPSCTYAQLSTPTGCSLTSGDKTTTKFTAANTFIPINGSLAAVGWESNDFFTITNNGTVWTLTWDFTPGSPITNASLAAGYQLTITDPSKIFDTAKISYVGTPVLAGASVSISNGGPTLNTAGPTTGTFTGIVNSATVSYGFLALPTSSISSVTIELTQKDKPPVPGPLPLLGAGAAFAYSRKLRRRVQSIAR